MVTAIIPAFNESGGILRAIETLKHSPLISEIIVIDDGSLDNTFEIATAAGVRAKRLEKNSGKGNAMQQGVMLATNEVILFCDGDMFGFSRDEIDSVVSDIIRNKSDMVIGMRSASSALRHTLPFLTQISGFRALKKSLWQQVPEQFLKGYQAELAINFVARRNNWRVKYVLTSGLHHKIKEDKLGIWRGLIARVKMIRDIVRFFFKLFVFNRNASNSLVKSELR